ncbi:MAG: glycoside hydrolase, partial [Actinomycetota bacterium]|nr:glycoside hydrolase [Actinomycetota bacterium]
MIGITPIYAADPIAVIIDPVNQYQTLEGWGTSLCWWANVVGGWNNNTKKNEIIDLLFDSTNGLGLNIARYNIGGGENPEHEHMRPGAEIPGYKITEGGGYDWNADANQRWCLQQAKNKGVNIFEAFTNSPPYWMTKNGCSAGSDTLIATNNLKDDYYDNFADYITEVIKHFKDYWGITFRTISPMNEPIAVWWGSESNQEGCHYDRDKQNLLIKEVGSSLSLKGLTDTKISAPEEYCTNDSKDSYNSYDSTAKSYISQVNTHTYTYKGIGNDHRGLKNAAANGGKRIWMSEVTCPFYGSVAHDHNDMTASMDLAANIMKSLKELEAVSYVYWQAVEDEAGQNNCGFIHA